MSKAFILVTTSITILLLCGCRKTGRDFKEEFEKFYGEYNYSYSNYDDIHYISTNELNVKFGIIIKNEKLYFFRDGHRVRTYSYINYSYANPENDYSDRTLIFEKNGDLFSVTFDLENFDDNKILIASEEPIKGGTNIYIKK